MAQFASLVRCFCYCEKCHKEHVAYTVKENNNNNKQTSKTTTTNKHFLLFLFLWSLNIPEDE